MAETPAIFGSGYSPAMIRALQQMQLGQTLAAGASKQDASSGLGVLAKALQGALGGYLTTSGSETAGQIEQGNQDTMAQALRAANGWKAPDTIYKGNVTRDDAGNVTDFGLSKDADGNITNEVAYKPGQQVFAPDRQRLYDVLARNPNTAGKGMELQMSDAKRKMDVDDDIAKKMFSMGFRPDANGALKYDPALAGQLGEFKRTEAFNTGLGGGQAELLTKPAVGQAMIPVKVAEETALNPVRAQGKGMETTATEAAGLPFVGPKAQASAMGSAIGTSNANLAPAPESPGVPPGMNRAGAGAFSTANATQQAEQPFVGPRAMSQAAGSALGASSAALSPPPEGAPTAPGVPNTRAGVQAFNTAAGTQAAQGGQQAYERERQVREEFNNLPPIRNYREAQTAFNSIMDAWPRDNKASDLNIVYGLAKLFDPGSVVREGEQTLVKSTASWPDWLQGAYNAATGGGRLDANTRASLVREAQGRMDSHQKTYDVLRDHYTGVATDYKINPARIFAEGVQPAPAAQAATPAPAFTPGQKVTEGDVGGLPEGTVLDGSDGKAYVIRGGKRVPL